MNIHTGDILTFRQWEDMASEFGVNLNGDIMTSPFLFTQSMKQFCGTSIHVKNVSSRGLITTIEGHENAPFSSLILRWAFCPEMFEDTSSYDAISTEELSKYLNS